MQSLSGVAVTIGSGAVHAVKLGAGCRLCLICGPCVIESRDSTLRHAEALCRQASELGIDLVFKSSYDKANRTAMGSFRGPGLDAGLEILSAVRSQFGLPVVTDVHSDAEARAAADAVDLLQIPAFLCRQTDLLLSAGGCRKPVMVKKGQFLHPLDMKYAVEKLRSSGCEGVLLCERGTSFGYRELVVDFRSLEMMRTLGCPVVFDATHSVQVLGGGEGRSSGCRQYVPALARAAVSVGVDGIFLEVHEAPDGAPSDGPNMLALSAFAELAQDLRALDQLALRTRR